MTWNVALTIRTYCGFVQVIPCAVPGIVSSRRAFP